LSKFETFYCLSCCRYVLLFCVCSRPDKKVHFRLDWRHKKERRKKHKWKKETHWTKWKSKKRSPAGGSWYLLYIYYSHVVFPKATVPSLTLSDWWIALMKFNHDQAVILAKVKIYFLHNILITLGKVNNNWSYFSKK
jgi:hypothetical protein